MSGLLLVTGGSRGIGAQVAMKAAAVGYEVVITYNSNINAANDVVTAIQKQGGTAQCLKADVGDEAAALDLFVKIDGHSKPLKGLVNNAGVVDFPASVVDMSVDRLERMFRTNITGSFIYAREAVKRMSTATGGEGGAIVNLSSAAALLGSPNQYVDYAASKGAIDSFTKGLALEVATQGIRVNGVRPGVIDTDIHASGGLPNRVAEMRNALPMKREGKAAEVADAIIYLLSDQASYVTGTTIDVTGGR